MNKSNKTQKQKIDEKPVKISKDKVSKNVSPKQISKEALPTDDKETKKRKCHPVTPWNIDREHTYHKTSIASTQPFSESSMQRRHDTSERSDKIPAAKAVSSTGIMKPKSPGGGQQKADPKNVTFPLSAQLQLNRRPGMENMQTLATPKTSQKGLARAPDSANTSRTNSAQKITRRPGFQNLGNTTPQNSKGQLVRQTNSDITSSSKSGQQLARRPGVQNMERTKSPQTAQMELARQPSLGKANTNSSSQKFGRRDGKENLSGSPVQSIRSEPSLHPSSAARYVSAQDLLYDLSPITSLQGKLPDTPQISKLGLTASSTSDFSEVSQQSSKPGLPLGMKRGRIPEASSTPSEISSSDMKPTNDSVAVKAKLRRPKSAGGDNVVSSTSTSTAEIPMTSSSSSLSANKIRSRANDRPKPRSGFYIPDPPFRPKGEPSPDAASTSAKPLRSKKKKKPHAKAKHTPESRGKSKKPVKRKAAPERKKCLNTLERRLEYSRTVDEKRRSGCVMARRCRKFSVMYGDYSGDFCTPGGSGWDNRDEFEPPLDEDTVREFLEKNDVFLNTFVEEHVNISRLRNWVHFKSLQEAGNNNKKTRKRSGGLSFFAGKNRKNSKDESKEDEEKILPPDHVFGIPLLPPNLSCCDFVKCRYEHAQEELYGTKKSKDEDETESPEKSGKSKSVDKGKGRDKGQEASDAKESKRRKSSDKGQESDNFKDSIKKKSTDKGQDDNTRDSNRRKSLDKGQDSDNVKDSNRRKSSDKGQDTGNAKNSSRRKSVDKGKPGDNKETDTADPNSNERKKSNGSEDQGRKGSDSTPKATDHPGVKLMTEEDKERFTKLYGIDLNDIRL